MVPLVFKYDEEGDRMQNKNPFAGLYAPLPDAKAYFDRIGYTDAPTPTLDCLGNLVKAHLQSVPFENLDVFHGHKEPSLETEALFEKIVLNRRGGYCFELNGLFQKLLEDIGFFCSCHIGRIGHGQTFKYPISHRVTVVQIAGERYFCDVGFGGPVPPEPAKIVLDTPFDSANGHRYIFTKNGLEITLSMEENNAFSSVLSFVDTPADPVDFLSLNAFCAYSPIEPFVHKQMVWRNTENGRCTLDGNTLRLHENGTVEEHMIEGEEQLRKVLLERFGIVYPGLLHL